MAMIGNIKCDESHDGHTFALAGWISTPEAWDVFAPRWTDMLSKFTLPNGNPVPEFHAADIVERDNISDSLFKGWSFQDEIAIFSAAVDVICDKKLVYDMRPVGCCISLPASLAMVDFSKGEAKEKKDVVWYLLAAQLFRRLVTMYPRCIAWTFMFDEQSNIAPQVHNFSKSLNAISSPQVSISMGFGSSAKEPPLQAADLFVYEWRKRKSGLVKNPHAKPRRSYERLKECRSYGASLQYWSEEVTQAAWEQHRNDIATVTSVLADCGFDEEWRSSSPTARA